MNINKASSLEHMPEYLSTQHLIALGIYPSIDAAYQARVNGYSPQYIKLRHKILYSKKSVIEFLESRTRPGENWSNSQSPALTHQKSATIGNK